MAPAGHGRRSARKSAEARVRAVCNSTSSRFKAARSHEAPRSSHCAPEQPPTTDTRQRQVPRLWSRTPEELGTALPRRSASRRLRVKGGKTPYENMFSGLPQTADIGVACRKEIPLAAPVEPPSNFKSPCKPRPLRSDPPDQPLAPAPHRRVGARRLQPAAAAAMTPHLFRPSACHLPDYA